MERAFLYNSGQLIACLQIIDELPGIEVPDDTYFLKHNILNQLRPTTQVSQLFEDKTFISQMQDLYVKLVNIKQYRCALACERVLVWHRYRVESLPGLDELRRLETNLRKYLPDTELFPYVSKLEELIKNYDLYIRRQDVYPTVVHIYRGVIDIISKRLGCL